MHVNTATFPEQLALHSICQDSAIAADDNRFGVTASNQRNPAFIGRAPRKLLKERLHFVLVVKYP